jgi:hypothetical protein
MANSKSQQYEVIKNGPLCLDKYCADIVPFGQGFNKKNSPMLGGAISNVFSKHDSDKKNYYSNGQTEAWTDSDGNIYVDGEKLNLVKTNKKFIVEDIYIGNNKVNEDYIDYIDENNYIRQLNGVTYYKINGNGEFTLSIRNFNHKFVFYKDTVKLFINYIRNNELYIDILNDNNVSELPDGIKKVMTISDSKPNVTFHLAVQKDWATTIENPDIYLLINSSDANGLCANFDISIRGGINAFKEYVDHNYLYLFHNNTWEKVSLGLNRSDYADESRFKVYAFKAIVPEIIETDKKCSFSYIALNYDLFASYMMNGWSGHLHAYFGWSQDLTLESAVDTIWNTQVKIFSANPEIFGSKTESIIDFWAAGPDPEWSKGKYTITIGLNNKLNYQLCPGYRYRIKNNYYTDNNNNVWMPSDTVSKGNILYKAGDALLGVGRNPIAEDIALIDDINIRLPIPDYKYSYNNNSTNSHFNVLINNGVVTGLSYTEDVNTVSNLDEKLGILVIPFENVSGERPTYASYSGNYAIYYDVFDRCWKKISIVDGLELYIVGQYILFNTTDPINAYNIDAKTDEIWANDWNNRIVTVGESNMSYTVGNKVALKIDSMFNPFGSVTTADIPSSALLEKASITFFGTTSATDVLHNLKPQGMINSLYDLTIFKDLMSTEIISYDNTNGWVYTDIPQAEQQVYGFTTTQYTPAITMSFLETYVNKDVVRFGKTLYELSYFGEEKDIERIIYDPSTLNTAVDTYFVIQGLSYYILRNKIYNYNVTNNVFTSSTLVADITGLKYLTFTPSMAYFWSDIDSSLYGFTADNIIRKLYTATDITYINNAIYYPSCNMTVFTTNMGILCYHEDLGMFIIGQTLTDNSYTEGKVFLQSEGYITYSDNESVTYFTLWFKKENGWTKNNVILATKFYGLGSNLISITDTWYLRLFADKNLYEQMDISRSGKLKLSIDALTDQGLSTETKEIDIKDSDWDELTDTLYIRYQPKLQRGVGISLNIDSPFAIGYLGLGNIIETTQMSKPSMQA